MNEATARKRIDEINRTLAAYPSMWPGCRAGFKAERTRLENWLKRHGKEA